MACKHFSQFSADDLAFAVGFIRKRVQPNAHGSAHFYDRANDRQFTLEDAKETLRVGRVIEIHNNEGEWRSLVRSQNGTCVVVSLENNKIITIYYNDPEDGHATLNWMRYSSGPGICIMTVIKLLVDERKANETRQL